MSNGKIALLLFIFCSCLSILLARAIVSVKLHRNKVVSFKNETYEPSVAEWEASGHEYNPEKLNYVSLNIRNEYNPTSLFSWEVKRDTLTKNYLRKDK